MTEPKRALRPRDAASLLILDRSGSETTVLMGRRSARHVFMPSKFVFPGGRVDRTDGSIKSSSPLHEPDERRLMGAMRGRPSKRRAHAMAVCALRETAEETGLLLGKGEDASSFEPNLAPLRYVARATTPVGRPRRYDTRFFAGFLDRFGIETSAPAPLTDELEEIQWVALRKAEQLDVPMITAFIIRHVIERLTVDPELRADPTIPHLYVRRGALQRDEH